MDSSNRTLWIVLAVVAVMLCGCCFALVLFLAPALLLGIPWTQDSGMLPSLPSTRVNETTEHVFPAGRQPDLVIDSFAGGIDIRPGAEDKISVLVTKSALNQNDLKRIEVDMQDRDGSLTIINSVPNSVRYASVKLEIMVPIATTLDIETGSGSLDVLGLDGVISAYTGSGDIELRDVTGSVEASTRSGGITVVGSRDDVKAITGSGTIHIGEVVGTIEARTNSGSLSVYNAEGQVQLATKSGHIEYEGVPAGDCRFETTSGGISLDLPTDLDMAVDLSTTVGSVDTNCDLVGDVTRTSAKGVVGEGLKGKIYAHTGAGSVKMNCR